MKVVKRFDSCKFQNFKIPIFKVLCFKTSKFLYFKVSILQSFESSAHSSLFQVIPIHSNSFQFIPIHSSSFKVGPHESRLVFSKIDFFQKKIFFFFRFFSIWVEKCKKKIESFRILSHFFLLWVIGSKLFEF